MSKASVIAFESWPASKASNIPQQMFHRFEMGPVHRFFVAVLHNFSEVPEFWKLPFSLLHHSSMNCQIVRKHTEN